MKRVAILLALLSQAPRDPRGYYVPPSKPGNQTCVVIKQESADGERRCTPEERQDPWSQCGRLTEAFMACCPGIMPKACCREWVVSGKPERPDCAVPRS